MSIFKFWKRAFCAGFAPLYLGGGGGSSDSQQRTDTNTTLTNNVSSTDSRSVASDGAIALGGAGDSVTQVSNTQNNLADNSVNNSKTNSDNTSTVNFTSNTTTTDFGSVQAALDGMKSTANRAIDSSGAVAGQALSDLTTQSQSTIGLLTNLFTNASTSSANSQGTAMQALGLANNSTAQAAAAINANDSKTQKIMLAMAGVVAAIFVFKI